MSAAPVAHYLAEFGRRAGAPALLRREAIVTALLRSPAEELADRLAEASAQGREEGRAAAQAEFNRTLEAERGRNAELLAAERARWVAEEGQRLGDLIEARLATVEESIATAATGILTPFIEARRRDVVLESLAQSLASLLGRNAAALVRVEGPEDLIGAVRERMGPEASHVAFRETDRPDIAILCDDTLIESCLQAWTQRLAEARDG